MKPDPAGGIGRHRQTVRSGSRSTRCFRRSSSRRWRRLHGRYSSCAPSATRSASAASEGYGFPPSRRTSGTRRTTLSQSTYWLTNPLPAAAAFNSGSLRLPLGKAVDMAAAGRSPAKGEPGLRSRRPGCGALGQDKPDHDRRPASPRRAAVGIGHRREQLLGFRLAGAVSGEQRQQQFAARCGPARQNRCRRRRPRRRPRAACRPARRSRCAAMATGRSLSGSFVDVDDADRRIRRPRAARRAGRGRRRSARAARAVGGGEALPSATTAARAAADRSRRGGARGKPTSGVNAQSTLIIARIRRNFPSLACSQGRSWRRYRAETGFQRLLRLAKGPVFAGAGTRNGSATATPAGIAQKAAAVTGEVEWRARSKQRRQALVERRRAVAAELLEADQRATRRNAFIAEFYEHVPPVDVAAREPARPVRRRAGAVALCRRRPAGPGQGARLQPRPRRGRLVVAAYDRRDRQRRHAVPCRFGDRGDQ